MGGWACPVCRTDDFPTDLAARYHCSSKPVPKQVKSCSKSKSTESQIAATEKVDVKGKGKGKEKEK